MMVDFFKKNILVFLLGVFVLSGGVIFANGSFLTNPTIQGENPSGVGSLGTDTIDVPQSAEDADETILDGIKLVINYVLGLLALITLILLIWGGLQILFASGDDAAYKKGFTILKNAAIALAFIAFSWLLVSLIFYVLDLVTAPG